MNGEFDKYKMVASMLQRSYLFVSSFDSFYLCLYSFKKMSQVPEAIKSSRGKLQNDYKLPAEERRSVYCIHAYH